MKKHLLTRLAVLAALMSVELPATHAQLNIETIDIAGDSISKGFNAGSAFPCSNADQEQFNWMTSDTHGANLCGRGSENVFSFVERLECEFGTNILAANPNHAASGARMLSDFLNQANNIRTYLNAGPMPRLAAVFLGHNDGCSTTLTKTNASCPTLDQDPNNYCRTRNDSFEREFRKGLDVLITIPETRIGVASPVRVSQLCNFGSKANCQLVGNCQLLWASANICGSLTRDCSDTRVIDAFNSMRSFREILKRVSADYAAIPEGGMSPVVLIGGEMVGGATKAAGSRVVYSDAPWFYQFNADQLSCCDCFHPSALGQDTLARLAKIGLSCSKTAPCCRETGDPLTDAKCLRTERKRVFYRGLL
jgi:hypothetical protein